MKKIIIKGHVIDPNIIVLKILADVELKINHLAHLFGRDVLKMKDVVYPSRIRKFEN